MFKTPGFLDVYQKVPDNKIPEDLVNLRVWEYDMSCIIMYRPGTPHLHIRFLKIPTPWQPTYRVVRALRLAAARWPWHRPPGCWAWQMWPLELHWVRRNASGVSRIPCTEIDPDNHSKGPQTWFFEDFLKDDPQMIWFMDGNSFWTRGIYSFRVVVQPMK